jgi:hypothetical protein
MTRPQNCGSGFCSCIECLYEPDTYEPITKANDTQVGGTHYRLTIEPWDYIVKNNLGYLEGNIIKYVTRYKGKHGVEDLQKARHYLDKLIETLTEDESWAKQTK